MDVNFDSLISGGASTLATLSPLLAAALGALAGALANDWFRHREAKKLTAQERLGLLSLLDREIKDNDTLLKIFIEYPKVIDQQSTVGLQTDTWDKAKVRLAQILSKDHLDVLVGYYSRLFVLKVTVVEDRERENVPEAQRASNEQRLQRREEIAKKARKLGECAVSLR